MTSAAAPNSSETHLPFPVHRLSVEQFRALAQAGVLAEDDRVELLEGVIVPKMNPSPRHSAAVHAIHDEAYADPTGPDSEPAYRRRDDYAAKDVIPLVIGNQEIIRLKAAEILP